MKRHFLRKLLHVVLLACPLLAAAEDIDLFLGTAPSDSANAPLMLLVLDNAANFSASVSGVYCRISAAGVVDTVGNVLPASDATALDGTAGGIEQCALYSVLKGLPTTNPASLNLGVMVFNATGQLAFNPLTGKLENTCVGSSGGCLVSKPVPLTPDNQAALLIWIRNWTGSGTNNGSAGDTVSPTKTHNIKVNALANGATMQEAWAYFLGKTGLSGRNYSDVKPTSACGHNYVVFIGNDYRNNSSPKDATGDAGPKNALMGINSVALKNASPAATVAPGTATAAEAQTYQTTVKTDTIPIKCTPASTKVDQPLATSENSGVYALNWAQYMNQQHSIITYSVGILGPTCNTEYAAHLTKLGSTEIGGGKYFATNNYEELRTSMNEIVSEIQSVNTVFASVSLPVSVNTQGTYLNQVYVGMFRPDADAFPRWNGNLKQYKLAKVDDTLRLQGPDDGATGTIINPSTGFIKECGRSYWTPDVMDTYWVNKQQGECVTAGSKSSNSPDGNIVEKGAQAYQLRSTTTRTVKTCSPVFTTCAATTTLTDFATSNATVSQTLLDSTSTVSKDILINWARGMNTQNELTKGVNVMRPTAHGDVVHSRPVAINHGNASTPDVVVYYGANDGMLHAVNGNRTSATNLTLGGGTAFAAGMELWSFMPPEFYGNIKRLYDNSVPVSFKTSTVTGAQPKPYGMDGPITAYQNQSNTTSLVFATMRRGGRAIYGFDVTIPGSPTLKWKKGCGDNFPTSGAVSDANCASGFTGIGQTWSAAKSTFATGYGAGASPLLIMGGGYDPCEDFDNGTKNNNCASGTKGNKIYVLDANDGTALRTFDTDRAVSGDVTIVADPVTKIASYAYATDLGGNVYRISGNSPNTPFGASAPGTWTITKIASLGCDTTASCPANRKFMFAPDVVYDNGFYILLIGSGDREKPLSNYSAAYSVQNHFFMIKDVPTDANWLTTGTCSGNIICKTSLLGITGAANPAQSDVDAKKGWYLGLAPHEQVVTTSVTAFGTVNFSTHQPSTAESAAACKPNLGTALVYNILYTNAASDNGTGSRSLDLGGDGLPPSPVAGLVTLDPPPGDPTQPGETVPFCIGCDPQSPLQGKYLKPKSTSSASPYKSRVFWYIEK